MSHPRDTGQQPVSASALSITLLGFSGLWLVAACEYFATSGLKVDWSGTPLLWMLAVVLTPALCFACGLILADQHRRRPLGLVERWALVAAFLPVTAGTLLSVWAVRVLFSMSGV